MTLDFEVAMKEHFEDDKKNFGELKSKTDKLSEQMVINGEHLSHFSKNLVEINTKLSGLKEDIAEIKTDIKDTNGRVGSLESDKLVKDTKFSTFMWVFGGLFGIIMGIAYYAYHNDIQYQREAIMELKALVKEIK